MDFASRGMSVGMEESELGHHRRVREQACYNLFRFKVTSNIHECD